MLVVCACGVPVIAGVALGRVGEHAAGGRPQQRAACRPPAAAQRTRGQVSEPPVSFLFEWR